MENDNYMFDYKTYKVPYAQNQRTWQENLKELFEVIGEMDFLDEIKRRQKAKTVKYLKKQRKRRNRTIALCTVAHSFNKAINDFLK